MSFTCDRCGIIRRNLDYSKCENCPDNYPANFKKKEKIFISDTRLAIYKKTNGVCYLCDKFVPLGSFTIDHKIPKAKGGTDEIENLFPAHHKCNQIKHSLTIEELIEIMEIILKNLKQK